MDWNSVDFSQLPSPCFLIDCDVLKSNLQTMKGHCVAMGISPLIAIKGFPLALIFDKMAPYISGISASSLFEARLGSIVGKEIHIHAPAYRPDEINEVLEHCDHVVFNSFTQWSQYKEIIGFTVNRPSIGLRINPEYSEIETEKYNPCLPNSRFGVTNRVIANQNISGIDGLHVHAMCDQNAEAFVRLVNSVIDQFGYLFPKMSWINFGGGQRLADKDFQIDLLQKPISRLAQAYGLKVYIEPCESVVTGSGFLLTTVLDIVDNGKKTAILDTSATCHMPDVLEMPYRPDIEFMSSSGNEEYRYVFAGISCLAGDIIGEYTLSSPLHIGDKIVFSDMGAYTFAKESYFNGINHPSIALYDKHNGIRVVKQYSYDDYKNKYTF